MDLLALHRNTAVRVFVLVTAIAGAAMLALASPFQSATAQVTRPNVVVVMTDDLDVGTLDTAAARGLMPNFVNEVRNKGTSFTNSFVSYSLCCPSRATFLTGQYAHNHQVKNNSGPEGSCAALDDTSTVATWLQAAGYRTGIVGKYLNGYGSDPGSTEPCFNPTYIPPGWNDWQAIPGNAQAMYNYKVNDNGVLVSYGNTTASYQTDVIRKRAVDFITEAPVTQPFVLYVAPGAPHTEPGQVACRDNLGEAQTIRPHPSYNHLADGIPLPRPASFNEADVSDKPSYVQQVPLMTSSDISCTERIYRDRLESLKSIDVLLGAVGSAVQSKGVLGNTVVIFTSDNGYFNGEHRLHKKVPPYEESLRVPLVVRYPSSLVQRTVGEFALNTDLAPTIAALAQATPTLAVDGQSLVPFLENRAPAEWRKRFLLEHWSADKTALIPTFFGIRTAPSDTVTPNVQYVELDDGSREFYSLTQDSGQLVNSYDGGTIDSSLVQYLGQLKTCGNGTCQSQENQ